MRVTALQLPSRWHRRAAALADVDALLSAGPATDLALLPEASLTGYVSDRFEFDLTPFAEPLEGPTAQALAALAHKHRTHLVGPLIERDGGALYNAMVGFSPTGHRVVHYRKRHPWFPETWATAGTDPLPSFTVGDATVTLAVCFDVHFLLGEPTSVEALTNADLMLFASAWVDEGHDERSPLLVDLSRRFECAVVNANWGEGRPSLFGQGGSVIYAPGGAVKARAVDGQGRALRIDADVEFY